MTATQETAWRAFVSLHHKLFTQLERELVRRDGLSEPDFAVLISLLDADDQRLRFKELRDELGWQKSRLSKQISRMTLRGLLSKEACDTDARGLYVALTPAGHDAILSALPGHFQDVRRWFIDCLTPEQLHWIEQSSATIVANLPQDG
ncbi:winged helix-turn-helix transcriptional regulator [Mycobacteroides abscessus subsp. bolletii]|uniref:MarR family winged helix-turn-helix transcriptional regulator n=1 Tax=Mycobacteroides abscessus TaxID=36809 RepID=UPI0019CFD3FD|nr:MarR family winged helix-turn-helix transcriptional regulator [Mycobacteroides abscessus]MBN7300805.1 winged helix-turn-helix transcriptional regulator [Mycobacteroides abscessus subsp. bolletii]